MTKLRSSPKSQTVIAPPVITQPEENQPGNKASLSSFADRDIAKRMGKVNPIVETFRQHSRTKGGTRALLLDIGAGSGVIGPAVAEELSVGCVGIDVADQRVYKGAPFSVASCEMLPFKSETFDYVLCNHIIEHVCSQSQLVQELQRVLKPAGLCYLATPNKYALLEPHYKLPLLSWLPQGWADSFVRLMRRGKSYDVRPVTRQEIESLASMAGMHATHLTLEMVSSPLSYGRKGLWSRLAGLLPTFLTRQLLILAPSYIWIIEAKK